jgi:hypothetical protein
VDVRTAVWNHLRHEGLPDPRERTATGWHRRAGDVVIATVLLAAIGVLVTHTAGEKAGRRNGAARADSPAAPGYRESPLRRLRRASADPPWDPTPATPDRRPEAAVPQGRDQTARSWEGTPRRDAVMPWNGGRWRSWFPGRCRWTPWSLRHAVVVEEPADGRVAALAGQDPWSGHAGCGLWSWRIRQRCRRCWRGSGDGSTGA